MQQDNTSKPRRRNTKERIIDEAESLAAFHGIEHLKLQDVADKIGIKLPSVYAHFSGREDILSAMSARVHRSLTQLFLHKAQESPRNILRRGSEDLATLFYRHPSYFRLMLRDLSVPLGYDPVNRRYSPNHGQSIAPEMKDLIERVRRQLEQIETSGQLTLSAERYVASILGALLVRLSWRETNPANPADDAYLPALQRDMGDLAEQLLAGDSSNNTLHAAHPFELRER